MTYRTGAGHERVDPPQTKQTPGKERLSQFEAACIGSRCGPFEPALRLVESWDSDPLPLAAARIIILALVAAFV